MVPQYKTTKVFTGTKCGCTGTACSGYNCPNPVDAFYLTGEPKTEVVDYAAGNRHERRKRLKQKYRAYQPTKRERRIMEKQRKRHG
jgi:hypothetical protein